MLMATPNKVTPEMRESMCADFINGTPVKIILYKYGITDGTLYHHLRRAGITQRRTLRAPTKDLVVALAMQEPGLTPTQISQRLGSINPGHVCAILKGLKLSVSDFRDLGLAAYRAGFTLEQLNAIAAEKARAQQ